MFVVRKMSIFDQVWFIDIFPSILSKLTKVDQTMLYFTSKSLRVYKLLLCKKREMCASAALGGHLELLKWAHENGCPWNSYIQLSKSNKLHAEIIEWCTSQALEFILTN